MSAQLALTLPHLDPDPEVEVVDAEPADALAAVAPIPAPGPAGPDDLEARNLFAEAQRP